jgi:hypothetical protein
MDSKQLRSAKPSSNADNRRALHRWGRTNGRVFLSEYDAEMVGEIIFA